MRHELLASRATGAGTETVLMICVDQMLSKEAHDSIRAFAPALAALVGRLMCQAWYDDETQELVIKPVYGGPPLCR